MKILAVDTSGAACSAALWRDGKLLGEQVMNSALTHSETVMPAVEAVLEREGYMPSDMDVFAVIAGPGSFTGVRIGVCAVKALCQATGKKVIRVDALEALAYGTAFDGYICPILDARREQVYCALFRREGNTVTRVMDDAALPLTELIASLPEGEKICFTGDGTGVHRARIEELMGDKAFVLPGNLSVLRASAACAIAEKGESEEIDPRELTPIYLRLPQAERERSERLTRTKI